MTALPSPHSALGGSGASRWLKCFASPRMAGDHHDPESEYASVGTAAHALAEYCFASDSDAWELIGHCVHEGHQFYPVGQEAPEGAIPVDKAMADGVQTFLDAVREEHPDRSQGNFWLERPFHCPDIHPLMYGRADVTYFDAPARTLHVWDYKNGAGIVVPVVENAQCLYYGIGMLTELDLWAQVRTVVLHICQPNGFMESPRSWAVTTKDLARWCDDVLVPGMQLAESVSRDTNLASADLIVAAGLLASGEHCRFCPARFLDCPRLAADMKRMEEIMQEMDAAGGAPKLSNEQLGEFLTLFELAKIRQKAARETAFMRATENGATIPGWKLAKGKSNRVWREPEQAEKLAAKAFGEDAFEPAALKSPARIEKLPLGKDFATQHAFKPEAGFQLVPEADARAEAGPARKAMFQPVDTGK